MRFLLMMLFCLIGISFTNCLGQSIYGRIEYRIQPIDFSSKSEDSRIKNIINDLLKEANKQIFVLDFTNNDSKFSMVNSLTMSSNNLPFEKQKIKLASTRFTSDFNYYLNKNENFVILEKLDGALIKMEYVKKKWNITSESKMIDKYLCYKANYINSYIGRDGKEKNIEISAWFAPSLPYSYGPKDYNGLPGLILELREKETTYYAASINFSNTKEFKIDFPKGKTISAEDYEKGLKTQVGM